MCGSPAGTRTYSLSSKLGGQWRHPSCGRLSASHLMRGARGIKVFVLLREHQLQPALGTVEQCGSHTNHQGC